ITVTEIFTPWGQQSLYPASFIGEQNFSIGPFSFVLTKELAHEKTNAFELAEKYLNTPYLWGGKATNGIDCSGLVQSVFRMKGLNLPRDAYQQEEIGIEVDFNDLRNDDVAFFSNKNGKIIHVGILNENSAIIHASGRVRLDTLTKEGIWNEDYGKLTHSLKNIKRFI
ncbi:MAG: C40 family peptidase, partial [Crocinitomicaceae bacterium]